MPAIYHEGSWLGNATDPEVLVKDTVGWTGKNRAYSQTNNAVIAHIESGITYDVSWAGSATVTLKKNSTSGATITSGSTSPLSFTADADYELYFGSSATVTNIMVKDSRITDPTYEPYHESVEEVVEQIYADNGVLGAKNLLPCTARTATVSGITFTVNADGSVTANGTASAGTYFALNSNILIKQGSYKISNGGVVFSGSGQVEICLEEIASGTRIVTVTRSNEEISFNIATDGYYKVFIWIGKSVTVNNLTFYPMIRLASDPDDTYQPYAMTNRELTEIVQGTVTSNFTWNGSIEKCGRTVMLNFSVATGTSSVAANTQLAVVPFKPKNNVFFFVRSNIDGSIRLAEMNTSGQIAINSALSNGGNLIGSVMYFS